MTRILSFVVVSFLGLFTQAQIAPQAPVQSPQSKAAYCALAKTTGQFLALASNSESRIAFENPYGYFSTGLCWWHSHLQRASIYLAYYNPAAAKPTAMQAYEILKNIYFNHNVTAIPGYKSFYDFTSDNQKLVTNFLSDVEILETAGGDWVHGVVGTSEVTAANLKLKMDQLYKAFSAKPALVYQMLQMPGLDAHAWLVENIIPTANGYALTIIDSNYPSQNFSYTYTQGQRQFTYPDDPSDSFVPYMYDQNQLTTFASRAASYCR